MRLFLILMFTSCAFSQAVRVDVPLLQPGPNVPNQGSPLPQALLQANATVSICNHPSSLSSCVPTTTYSDSTEGTSCPSSSQLTILPSTSCTASVGTNGKLGFWYAGGTVDYYVTINGYTTGPYAVTVANSALATPLYSTTGVLLAGHTVMFSGNFSGGLLTVSLSGAAVFSSSTSYFCRAQNTTSPGNVVVPSYSSGSSFTLLGNSTDAVRGTCTGD